MLTSAGGCSDTQDSSALPLACLTYCGTDEAQNVVRHESGSKKKFRMSAHHLPEVSSGEGNEVGWPNFFDDLHRLSCGQGESHADDAPAGQLSGMASEWLSEETHL